MRIIWTNSMFKTNWGFFNPYTRYIVSDMEWESFNWKKDVNTDLHWSCFQSYERRYGGQDLNGKKLLIYRHNAYGDQLMASSLPRYIKHLYPESIIHFYCAPPVMPLWAHNPYVQGSAIPLPIHFDCHDKYDYHLFFEGMLESNSERDQNCCYDDMFAFAGFRDVAPEWKRPCIFELPEDYAFFQQCGFGKRPYVVYHAAPANKNRTYPLAAGRQLCDMLVGELGMDVLVVGHDEERKYVKLFDPQTPRTRSAPGVVNLINQTKNFRDLIPIIKHAKCTICPDSSVMHLAAAFDAPCVSLWGIFNPNDRAKYYKNQVALTGFNACPHAPCRDHNFYLPESQCKDAGEKWGGKYCAALEAIKPERIVGTVKEMMS